MRTVCKSLCVLLSALLFLPSLNAQKLETHGLLWRISARDGGRPSYLWGTIHIKDRRVFHFTDSLYGAISATDGYAMEIDPDSAVAMVMKFFTEPDTSSLVSESLSADDFRKLSPWLEKNLKMPAGKVTRKRLYSFLMNRSQPRNRKDDMPEAMDIYLGSIARSMGKVVTGIEDVTDQFNPAIELREPIDIPAILNSKDNVPQEVEKLVRIYLAQDLRSIMTYTSSLDSLSNGSLLRRNHKMVRRIDSLMQHRPTLFTVGAAHLPGMEGVIQLLRQRGFDVQAVSGGKRIPPDSFTFKRDNSHWKTNTALSGNFTVEMPGEAALMNEGGIKMQVFADIHTDNGYFISSFPVSADESPERALRRWTSLMSSRASKSGTPGRIEVEGRPGTELFYQAEGLHYRLQGFVNGGELVFLMAMSQTKDGLKNDDPERFFGSVHFLQKAPVKEARQEPWVVYSDSLRGYAVDFPGQPDRNEALLAQATLKEGAENWNFESQVWYDFANKRFFILVVKDTRSGFYIAQPRYHIAEAPEVVRNNPSMRLVSIDSGDYHGLPAVWVNALMKDGSSVLRTFHVNRDNRSFSMIVGMDPAKDDSLTVLKFFNSLRFRDYPQRSWKQSADSSGLFSVHAPDAIHSLADEDAGTVTHNRFVTYDSTRANTYFIDVIRQQRWRWIRSDSAFYASLFTLYREAGDSLLSEKAITLQGRPAREYITVLAERGIGMRMLLVGAGDSIYALYAHLPVAQLREAQTETLFGSFALKTAAPFMRDRGSAEGLLAYLRAGRAEGWEEARSSIEAAHFDYTQLPLLHEAMLEPFMDFDSSGTTVHDIVMQQVASFNDSSTLSFILSHYSSLKGMQEKVKLSLLTAAARYKTAAAYAGLKGLLLEGAPQGEYYYPLRFALSDSLELSRTLFPEVGRLFADSNATSFLLPVMTSLIDSGMLRVADMEPYAPLLLAEGRRRLAGKDNGLDFYSFIKWFGQWNRPEGNALLHEVLRGAPEWQQVDAVGALLRNRQPVSAGELLPIAADQQLRVPLYEALSVLKQEQLFPAAFRNQKALAQSQVAIAGSEDYDIKSIGYVGSRDRAIRGKMRRFYLFRVAFNGDEDHDVLALSGPFAIDPKVLLNKEVTGLIGEEPFDAKKVEAQFNALLKGLLERED
jgi:uncharacterized protein YbaP (TraB family)